MLMSATCPKTAPETSGRGGGRAPGLVTKRVGAAVLLIPRYMAEGGERGLPAPQRLRGLECGWGSTSPLPSLARGPSDGGRLHLNMLASIRTRRNWREPAHAGNGNRTLGPREESCVWPCPGRGGDVCPV